MLRFNIHTLFRHLAAAGAFVSRAWKRLRPKLLSLSISAAMIPLLSLPVFASTAPGGGSQDIWTWLQTSLTDLYGKFVSLSTIAACVAAAACFLMMTYSTNDKTVSTAHSWRNRIVISWLVINTLGFIMTYLTNLTSGGQYVA